MNKTKEKKQPVKVFIRVRPLNDAEILRGSNSVVECATNYREVIVNERPSDKMTRKFSFDRVFLSTSKQVEVYKSVAAPLIKEVLDGYNCTIFAYGQTGSGKTYTMEGRATQNQSKSWNTDSHAGIIPRAIAHLFDELRLLDVEYSVRASFLEIYNEELFDLLSPVDDTNKLRLYEDAVKKGAIVVNGLDEIVVRSKEEVFSLLEKGSKKRSTATTLMNASSSRSHSVFSIVVRIKENSVDDEELVRTGKLNLVDLAGSENIGRSGAVQKRAREAGSINQSLLTLGRVITALVEKTPHIPYRESKLTRLLQESLGGRTKTCIIGTISPSQCSVEETLSTLDYAHRAKNIQNKPEINQKIGKAALIQEYVEEIERLKADLTASRQKNGVYLAEENYQQLMTQIESQKRELSVLLGEMKSATEILERKEELNRQLNESLGKYMQQLESTKILLEESEVLLQHRVGTEEILSRQAQDLLSVADTATNHVNLLHESLGRKRNVEANNLTAIHNLTSKSQKKLSDMKDMTLNFQEYRVNSNQEILNIVGKGQEMAEMMTREMADSTNVALQTAIMLSNRIQGCSENLVSQTGMIVNSAISSTEEASHRDTQELMQLLEFVIVRIDQMSKKISQYHLGHQKNIKELFRSVEEREEYLQNYLVSSVVLIDEVNKEIQVEETNLQNSVENMTKHTEYMSREFGNALQIMQNAIQRNNDVINVEVDSIKSSLISKKSDANRMKTLELDVHKLKEDCESYKSSINVLLNENSEMIVPVLKEFEGLSSEINAEIDAQKLRIPEIQRESTKNVVKNFNLVSNTVTQFFGDHKNGLEDLRNHAQEFTNTHNQIIEQTKQEYLEVNEKCKSHVAQDMVYLNDWKDRTTKNISDCVNMLEECTTKEIQEDRPTGKTPQRQDFTYPRILAATSPHERILSRFHAARIEDTVMESAGREDSSTEKSMESLAGSSASDSKNLTVSSNNLQYQVGECKSKSSSDLRNATSNLSLKFKSEPNITNFPFGN